MTGHPRWLLGLELTRLAWRRLPGRPAQTRWFEHYTTLFDTVELNNTFYDCAKETTVAKGPRRRRPLWCSP